MTWVIVALIAASVVGLAFFNGAETCIYSLNRLRLRLAVSRGGIRARTIMRLLQDPEGLVASVLVGTNICVYAASAMATWLAAQQFAEHAELVSMAVLTVPLSVFGELVPKDVFRLKADVLGYVIAPVLRFFYVLFRPLTFLPAALVGLSRRRKDADFERTTRRKVAFYFREGAREGLLTSLASRVLENVMTFSHRCVRDVMTPSGSMTDLSSGDDVFALKEAIARTGYTRYPVRDERTGRYLGIVHFFDAVLARDRKPNVADLVRTVPTLRSQESLENALWTMRRASSPMALVADGSGDVVGLVTLKDIVEQITGDIAVW